MPRCVLSADRGSASVLVLALALAAAALAIVIADTGRYLFAVAQAQTAADAAALAAAPVTFRPFGATGTARQEAARFARANGAFLTRCRCPQDPSFDDRDVVVEVRMLVDTILRGRLAVAGESRARFSPGKMVSGSQVEHRRRSWASTGPGGPAGRGW